LRKRVIRDDISNGDDNDDGDDDDDDGDDDNDDDDDGVGDALEDDNVTFVGTS
jgi:hypothetical protein